MRSRRGKRIKREERTESGDDGLAVVDLHASFGHDPIVRGVDLELSRGCTLSLLGPSGCGKTTLLRTIAGLHPLDRGTVRLGGKTMADSTTFVPPEHRKVGMVFQDGALFPHLSVLENVLFGLRGRDNALSRAHEVLGLVAMDDCADRSPGTLSGGQQQRVALARALAPEPEILLLDEPFSALDAGLRVELRREVKRILAGLGVTVVVVTHDQEEAFVLGDQIAVMREGKIVQSGSPRNLYETPVSAWVAGFVGEANLLEGTGSVGIVETEIGAIPIQSGPFGLGSSLEVVVRPEQLVMAKTGDALVTSLEFFGHDVRYEVRLPSGLNLGIRSSASDFAVGDLVEVGFRGGSATAWDLDVG